MEDIVDISSCRCWLHYCLLVYVLALQCALNIHCVLKAAFSGCKNTADVEQQINTTAKTTKQRSRSSFIRASTYCIKLKSQFSWNMFFSCFFLQFNS